MNNNEFRKYGHELIDWLADYFSKIEKYPVKSQVAPGDVKQKLPARAPENGEDMNEIIREFEQIIMPGITHWQHPGWFAYFPANNSPESVLGELLTAGLGAQCMIWETSPAAAELEEVVMNWLRDMLGLPAHMTGVIQDSASSSTLAALLTAREAATGFRANEEGIKKPLTVYVSEETHSSVEKGMKIAGYGRENLRLIPTDASFAMDTATLEKVVRADISAGYQPACVVGTVGTTSSTAVDPLAKIGEIATEVGMWFHVDAAFAGTAAVLEDKRQLLQGVEKADSFVFNPHKWMLTNFDCSAYFVKDAKLLTRTFEIDPEYLKTGQDSLVNNYRDWGVPLGRRFRALKLWFVLRSYGVSGIQEMVRRHITFAQDFRKWVEEDVDFELMAPVPFSLVCFRYHPKGAAEEKLDRLNKRLLDRINASGKIYLTHTSLRGKYTLRMAIGSRTTERRHVEEAWRIIKQAAREALQEEGTLG